MELGGQISIKNKSGTKMTGVADGTRYTTATEKSWLSE